MPPETRTRRDLKRYFVRNAIPSEQNFAELIEGALNQADDRVTRLAEGPLAIEAAGGTDPASNKPVLGLYETLEQTAPSWLVSLNPGAGPDAPDSANPGLSIDDAQGASRLFIDREQGWVGLGTHQPAAPLQIVAGAEGESSSTSAALVLGRVTERHLRLEPRGLSGYQEDAPTMLRLQSHGGGLTVGKPSAPHIQVGPDGAVGIGDKLPTRARLRVGGAVRAERVGLGVMADENLLLTLATGTGLGKPADQELSVSTAGVERLRVGKQGNVGVGTSTPAAPLHLVAPRSELRIENTSNSQWAFLRLKGPGGSWDIAQHGGGSNLEFRPGGGAANRLVMTSQGRLGLGTDAPSSPLHVAGTIDASLAGGGLLTLGPVNGTNLVLDGNEVLARKNGVASTLFLQTNGGPLSIHGNQAASKQVVVTTDGALGVGTKTPKGKLDVRGDFNLMGSKPIVLRRFRKLGNDTKYDTKVSSKDFAAAIVGFAALHGDISESGTGNIIQLFMYQEGTTWRIRANFKTNKSHENWWVDVMFIRRAMADQKDAWERYA